VAAITALAAVVAPVTAWLSAVGSRRHERQIARDTRLYADVRDAYADLVAKLQEYESVMDLSKPRDLVDGPPPAVADLAKDSEWTAALLRASARVATVGSEEVAEAVKTTDDAFEVFWKRLGTAETGSREVTRTHVEEARVAFTKAVRDLERLMRRDVRR
jgi:hypothetical protein